VDFNGIFKPRAVVFRGEAMGETKDSAKESQEKRENLKIEEAKEISYEKERKNKPVKS
jgi:hypothetical protein